jgi:ankyrin repeat protein
VNYSDRNGVTPLILAAQSGDLNICKLLIKNRADVNKVNDFNNTAIGWAVAENHFKVVEELLKAGANPEYGYKRASPTGRERLKSLEKKYGISNSNIELSPKLKFIEMMNYVYALPGDTCFHVVIDIL